MRSTVAYPQGVYEIRHRRMRHDTRDHITKRVLVIGATGRFGAISERLLERGHRVRAGARDLDAPGSIRLRELGARPVRADFDEPATLEVAAAGVDVVFASGTAHRAGPEGEARHGRNLVDALRTAEAPRLVFVSGDGAAADSPIPPFRAKWEVEEAIRASGVPHTILAPTYLMENLFNPWNLPALQAGVLPSPVAIDRPLQQTAVSDLLALAVLAIERPEEFTDRRLALASDELTAEESAAAISALLPRSLEPRQAPPDLLPPGVRSLFEWLGSAGHAVDRGALNAQFLDLGWHDYTAWARSQLDRFRELCQHPEPVAG
jgi:uncharacterized protein YbjT (DUF2867 family)